MRIILKKIVSNKNTSIPGKNFSIGDRRICRAANIIPPEHLVTSKLSIVIMDLTDNDLSVESDLCGNDAIKKIDELVVFFEGEIKNKKSKVKFPSDCKNILIGAKKLIENKHSLSLENAITKHITDSFKQSKAVVIEPFLSQMRDMYEVLETTIAMRLSGNVENIDKKIQSFFNELDKMKNENRDVCIMLPSKYITPLKVDKLAAYKNIKYMILPNCKEVYGHIYAYARLNHIGIAGLSDNYVSEFNNGDEVLMTVEKSVDSEVLIKKNPSSSDILVAKQESKKNMMIKEYLKTNSEFSGVTDDNNHFHFGVMARISKIGELDSRVPISLLRLEMDARKMSNKELENELNSIGNRFCRIRLSDLTRKKEEHNSKYSSLRYSLYTPEGKEILERDIKQILINSGKHIGKRELLIPNIIDEFELQEVLTIIDEIKDDLRKKETRFDEKIQIGAMIENPWIINCDKKINKVKNLVDFISFGINDFSYYLSYMFQDHPEYFINDNCVTQKGLDLPNVPKLKKDVGTLKVETSHIETVLGKHANNQTYISHIKQLLITKEIVNEKYAVINKSNLNNIKESDFQTHPKIKGEYKEIVENLIIELNRLTYTIDSLPDREHIEVIESNGINAGHSLTDFANSLNLNSLACAVDKFDDDSVAISVCGDNIPIYVPIMKALGLYNNAVFIDDSLKYIDYLKKIKEEEANIIFRNLLEGECAANINDMQSYFVNYENKLVSEVLANIDIRAEITSTESINRREVLIAAFLDEADQIIKSIVKRIRAFDFKDMRISTIEMVNEYFAEQEIVGDISEKDFKTIFENTFSSGKKFVEALKNNGFIYDNYYIKPLFDYRSNKYKSFIYDFLKNAGISNDRLDSEFETITIILVKKYHAWANELKDSIATIFSRLNVKTMGATNGFLCDTIVIDDYEGRFVRRQKTGTEYQNYSRFRVEHLINEYFGMLVNLPILTLSTKE
jgi:hypothetical protein